MDNLAGKTVLQATFLFVILSHFYLVKTSKTNIKMSLLIILLMYVLSLSTG